MKRRNFIKGGLVAGLTPLFINGYSMSQLSATMAPASSCNLVDDRILVVVYLAGANDVINMAVPLDDVGNIDNYAAYVQERPNIHLKRNLLTTLDKGAGPTKQLGLHPSLVGTNSIKSLYDDGKVTLVQRVSYPSPNRSHFRAEDIILQGLDGTANANTTEVEGWMGRWLENRYPTYAGVPFGVEEDPLGIIVGSTPSTGFHTQSEHSLELNLSGQDPAGFYSLISSLSGDPIAQLPNSEYGRTLEFMAGIEKSTQIYSSRISDVFNNDVGNNCPNANYPNSDFGNQMRTIARIICGGSRTKVYMARKGGWDNHVSQVVTNNTTTGTHANLLKDLNDSIAAFQQDLEGQGNSGRVMTVVFSEFGRKIIENGNAGTDHGTMSSMFIIGDQSAGGIFGDNIDLTNKDAQGAPDPNQLQYDYRRVFGSVLQDWMGADTAAINTVFPGITPNFNPVKPSQAAGPPNCYFEPTQPIDMFVRGKVYLGGFLKASGKMSTALVDDGLISYTQPYGNTKFNYFGDEKVTSFPANTVDWVLLEVINSSNVVVHRQAALLRDDGRLLSTTGSLQIPLNNLYPETFRISIRHRNHIGVVMKNTINAVDGANPYFNLTASASSVQGDGQLKNYNGKFALFPGDTDQNGVANSADYSFWKRSSADASAKYDFGDFNGDGTVDEKDYLLWKADRSQIANPDLYSNLKR